MSLVRHGVLARPVEGSKCEHMVPNFIPSIQEVAVLQQDDAEAVWAHLAEALAWCQSAGRRTTPCNQTKISRTWIASSPP